VNGVPQVAKGQPSDRDTESSGGESDWSLRRTSMGVKQEIAPKLGGSRRSKTPSVASKKWSASSIDKFYFRCTLSRMAQKVRLEFAGALHHVPNRTDRRGEHLPG
jgi:hypothetical protein